MVPTSRSHVTAAALLALCTLAPSLCGAQQLTPAPINPEFVAYWDARLLGTWETVTQDGHGLGYIPAPARPERSTMRPFGVPRSGLPASYDLRQVSGKLPPVRDQGQCGSCWAFATYSSAESCLRPTDTSDLSENHLKNTHGFDWSCCAGGNDHLSTAYLTRWGGPVFESDDPYSASSCASPAGLSARRHAQEVICLPERSSATDNDAVKNAVMQHGAVFMAYYHSSAYYNSTHKSYYYPGGWNPNHAVAIVGWDDDYPAGNFNTTAPGNGAFIVRNSWGTGWGDSGYFYMSYYDTQCGWFVVFAKAESAANYEKIYQYDPYGWVGSYNSPWAANVFSRGGSNERLDAVGLYTPAVNMTYEVRIYLNPTSGPTGGTLATTQTGTYAYSGFHTVRLANPVSLGGTDTRFAVWVKMTGASYPSVAEYRISNYCSAVSAAPDQSYYSLDGSSWTDLTFANPTANFCIKAYSSSGGPNTPPTDPTSVIISPSSPKTTDDLTVAASGSTDPDGGSPSYQCQWAKMPAGGSSWEAWGNEGPTLDSSKTTKGEQWKARARAYDGIDYSNWVESSPVTVVNTPPTAPTSVHVSPGDPSADDDLTASASGGTDPDSPPDAVSYGYQWAKIPAGGSSWGPWGDDGPTIDSSKTAKGEQWKARARAFDGTAYSNWVESSPVTIDNMPPTDPTSVDVSPDDPTTQDNLTVAASGSTNPDGGPPSYEYQWAKMPPGGSSWEPWGNDGPILDSSKTAKGEQWKARARALDGAAYSNWVESSAVGVGNAPPTAPTSVDVSPERPTPDDDLTASASGSTDPDAPADAVSYEYQWAKMPADGSSWEPWGDDGPTIESSKTVKGQQWKARARASDGTEYSNWVESWPVTIGNSPPTDPTSVDVSPDAPSADDDLTASASGSTDPDGGPITTYTYQWAKMPAGGSSWEAWGNSGATLQSWKTAAGERWKARARAFDGADYSNWVEGSPVTIDNVAPTDPTSVTISPGNPTTTDDLTASASGSTDPDGGPITYEYQWAKRPAGGSSWEAWGNDGPTLDSSNTAKGERWKARARAFDGIEYSEWVESAPVRVRNTPPKVDWAGTPGFLADGVGPNTGEPNDTIFTFAVRLIDPDETEPASMTVEIRRLQDRRNWVRIATLPLTATSGASWSEGMICKASRRLPNGVYTYRFAAQDDGACSATGEPGTWQVGPRLDAVPQLWCTALKGRTQDFVHPNTGRALGTRFSFSVQYTDGDGTMPEVRRIELQKRGRDGSWRRFRSASMAAAGGSPTSGRYYTWKRKLPAGEYRHRFVFADHDGAATGFASSHANATQWQPGPTVTESTSDAVAGSTAGTPLASLSATPSPAGAQITVSLTCAAQVDARVLNVAGRQVKTICRGRDCAAGKSTVLWNAQSDSGSRVPSGVYLIEVVAHAPDGRQARALSQVRISR